MDAPVKRRPARGSGPEGQEPAPVHFLHIRKTGGTSIKAALRGVSVTFGIVLHDHKYRMPNVPPGHPVMFCIRDPVSRFISGFNDRLRQGRPRFEVKWNRIERHAFENFQSPNELAEALSSARRRLRKSAEQAMNDITHVKTPLSHWLDSVECVKSRLSSIVWIGQPETLEEDFEAIKSRLKLPRHLALPDDDEGTHRTPAGFTTELNEAGRKNIADWYAEDMKLYDFLRCARDDVARRDFVRPLVPTAGRIGAALPPSPGSKGPKVFGIGFHKTGTKSLGLALRKLGYSVRSATLIKDTDLENSAWEKASRLIEMFDAFEDNPWPILFKEIYAYRPDSKFILTIRSTDSWLRSVTDHFGEDTTPMREWIYGAGSPVGNQAVYRERYDRHNREVREFFADKPGSLLVMDFAAGDGWQKLCEFLGETNVPAKRFPHKNSKGSREHRKAKDAPAIEDAASLQMG
jgi:hypothetical protein